MRPFGRENGAGRSRRADGRSENGTAFSFFSCNFSAEGFIIYAMKATVKKIWNIITTVIVVLAVILVVLLVGVRLFGVRVFTVLSGSMEPAYKTGSVIYVKPVDPLTLETGDVITFMMDEDTVATHRIAGIVPDEDEPDIIRFRTKGDANDMEDATLVHCANVVGTPIFSIPGLGYVVNYIQNPPGTYIAISMGALLLMLVFLPDLFDEEEEKKPKKEKTRKRRKEEDRSGDGETPLPAPVKEPKPVREKPAKEPKPVREKPAKEPKPVREKPVKEPKPVKEKPVKRPEPAKEPVKESAAVSAPAPEEVYDLESILAEFGGDNWI